MKESSPVRIANLVARAAPGPLAAVFLVIGTLLLLVGGLAHTDITMRSGVVHGMHVDTAAETAFKPALASLTTSRSCG